MAGLNHLIAPSTCYLLLCQKDNDWDDHLPYVMMAYRSRPLLHRLYTLPHGACSECTLPDPMFLDVNESTTPPPVDLNMLSTLRGPSICPALPENICVKLQSDKRNARRHAQADPSSSWHYVRYHTFTAAPPTNLPPLGWPFVVTKKETDTYEIKLMSNPSKIRTVHMITQTLLSWLRSMSRPSYMSSHRYFGRSSRPP